MSAAARKRLLGPFVLGLAAVAISALPDPARAVIVATGDGTGNTTAPDDDFGFANVGAVGETAVYLGNGWMITANHVSGTQVTLNGIEYKAIDGSKQRLRNATARVSSDVAIFRLQGPLPELPALPIRQTPPQVGDAVVLMGNGPGRGDPIEVEGHRGWEWAGSGDLRWGTNQVHARGIDVQASVGDLTSAFSMRLSPTHPTPHESTVAIGDSGGGAFIKNGDTWELAGVLFAAKTWEGQPPRTTLYGNITFAADLSVYRDQILAVTRVPACRDGLDDDGDGRVDFPEDPNCSGPEDLAEGMAGDVIEGVVEGVEPEDLAPPPRGPETAREKGQWAWLWLLVPILAGVAVAVRRRRQG